MAEADAVMFLEKKPIEVLTPFVSLYGLEPHVITELGKYHFSSSFILVANRCLNISISGIQGNNECPRRGGICPL